MGRPASTMYPRLRSPSARGQAQHQAVQEGAVAHQRDGERVGQPHLVVALALVVLLERGQPRGVGDAAEAFDRQALALGIGILHELQEEVRLRRVARCG